MSGMRIHLTEFNRSICMCISIVQTYISYLAGSLSDVFASVERCWGGSSSSGVGGNLVGPISVNSNCEH